MSIPITMKRPRVPKGRVTKVNETDRREWLAQKAMELATVTWLHSPAGKREAGR